VAIFKHPESLNAWQRFSQARAVLRQTTHASNPAWYQDAVALDAQLHLRVDGLSVATFVYTRSKNDWHPGPKFDETCLRDPAKMDATAEEILKLARTRKFSALGVVLHLADEFATAELKPELDNPAALPDLRDAAVQDPLAILDDSSVSPDQHAWRVLPYFAQGSPTIGTTITVSRQHAPFLAAVRQAGETHNFPLITRAISAPLVATMGIADYLPLTPGKAFVAILQYPWFTVLEFFNEHADLKLIRTLQHRHLERATNLRQAVSTTNASLELTDPDVFILPLGPAPDTRVHDELIRAFFGSRVSIITPPTPDSLPPWCLEALIAAVPPPHDAPPASNTFDSLRADQWALQDFLPTPREIVEIYPARAEMRLLQVLKLSRIALFAVTVLILAWLSLSIYDIIRRDEWSFDPKQTNVVKGRLAVLSSEREKIERWDSLLADRSKAWASMELLSRMFPERSGVLVKAFTHTVRPDQAPGQATLGFIKEWKITGLARDEAVDRLNDLNTQKGITARFAEVARLTDNPAFDPAIGNRSLAVNVRTELNSRFNPLPLEQTFDTDESSYSFSFDLTITQRFEATDPMALTVGKTSGKR
jgi:hypothetical protein